MECLKEKEKWVIHLSSDKLYYLEIHIIKEGIFKKLSIPSGRCTLFPEKFSKDEEGEDYEDF